MMKNIILILLGLLLTLKVSSQNATLVFKANPEFERYPLELIRETTYGLLGADKITGDSLTFSIPVNRPEGEYFRVWGWNALIVYLKPGSRVVVDYKPRARHTTGFEGDLVAENRWLNQESMLRNSVIGQLPGENTSWQDFCRRVDVVTDSLRSDLEQGDFSPAFVLDSRIRLDFLRLLSMQGAHQQLNMQKKDRLSPEEYGRWAKEHDELFRDSFLKQVRQVMARYPEKEVLRYTQVCHVMSAVSRDFGSDFVVSNGYSLFDELFRFVMLKINPEDMYGAGLQEYAKIVKDSVIRNEVERFMEKNRRLLAGADAMDFEFTDINGKSGRLSDFKGIPLYIDVWATWCNPCKALAPSYQELADEYRGKNIRFLSVSIDKQRTAWENYLKKQSHHANVTEVHTAGKEFMKKYDISGIPRFILIDKDFKIRMAFGHKPLKGYMQELRSLLDQLEKE